MNQAYLQKLKSRKNPNIHSKLHYLTDKISKEFGERNKFAMYLGAIKRVGVSEAEAIYNDVKSSDNPGRLFMWSCSKKGQAKRREWGK